MRTERGDAGRAGKKPHIPAKMKGKSERKKERWSCVEMLVFPFLNSLENMIVTVLNVLTIQCCRTKKVRCAYLQGCL